VIPSSPSVGGTATQNTGTGLAAQGITIQVNELDAPPDPSAQPTEVRLVSKLQGVSLLMAHEEDKKPVGWKCLNYADVFFRPVSGDPVMLVSGALVPNRFSWQNGIAVATITYNNEPLSAPGPLSSAAFAVDPPPGSAQSGIQVSSDVLIYRYAASKPLTPLVSGRNYRPQPFLVPASGVVPKIVAKSGSLYDLADAPDDVALGADWRTVEYRRLSQVGQLRLSNSASDGRDLSFPAIPDGVFPLTAPDPDATKKSAPLLMLIPPDDGTFYTQDLRSKFSFVARPPATDLLTWDRFVNDADMALKTKRETVFTGVLSTIGNNLANARSRSAEAGRANDKNLKDITLDDPATVDFPKTAEDKPPVYTSRFAIEIVGSGKTPRVVAFPPPSAADGVGSVQAGAVKITIQSAKGNGTPDITGPDNDITVTVPEGSRAQLRMSVCIPPKYASKFRGLASKIGASGFTEASPIDMNIEVATNRMPTAIDLFAKLAVDQSFNTVDGVANIGLDLAGVSNSEFVHSAEVLRQVWKWQGRPVDPMLPEKSKEHPYERKWLVNQFATRADSDYLRSAMRETKSGESKFQYTEKLASLFTNDERASSNLGLAPTGTAAGESALRGTYIRYGVQAESRYRPLIKALPPHTDSREMPGLTRGGDGAELWKGLYVPSRKLTGIRPPDVKLALPLTRNADNPAQGPGILVQIRGPWFQTCGLGETLEAKLVMVQDPGDAPTTADKTFYFQYGPDPLLKSSAGTLVSEKSAVEKGWTDGTITGPVGHSFDTVADDQLFVNTSFVLNYPDIKGISASAWSFCQLQVRRAAYVLDATGSKTRAGQSDWTAPMWAQLLPDFDLYSDKSKKFSGLRLKPDSANNSFSLTDEAGNSVVLVAGTGDKMFDNYLAITHFVTDVTGVPVQESFDYLLHYAEDVKAWKRIGPGDASMRVIGKASSGKDVSYRGRVITVQGRPGITLANEDAFWDALFNPILDKGDAARMRIVGVSRPIDGPNSPFPGC
jgi:hypothetical protein